jgi:hypothetical protein
MSNPNDFYVHCLLSASKNALISNFPHDIRLTDGNQPESLYEVAIIDGSIHRDFYNVSTGHFLDVVVTDPQLGTLGPYRFTVRPGRYTSNSGYWMEIVDGIDAQALLTNHIAAKMLPPGRNPTKKIVHPPLIGLQLLSAGVEVRFSPKMQRHLKKVGTGASIRSTLKLDPTMIVIDGGGQSIQWYRFNFDPSSGFRRLFAISDLVDASYFGRELKHVMTSATVEEADTKASSYIHLNEYDRKYYRLNTTQISTFGIHFVNEYGERVILSHKCGYALIHIRKIVK